MSTNGGFSHIPVLAEETVELLAVKESGVYLDGTLGMGGHTAMLLKKLPGITVIGTDLDPEMTAAAAENLKDFGGRVKIVRGNFSEADRITAAAGVRRLSGALLDLGISSLHLDKAERGFGFRNEGPLDMRLNPEGRLTAEAVVNYWPYEQLEEMIRLCGEQHSRRITKKILERRAVKPIKTTSELAALISEAAPQRGERIHPATKTFMAIRIAVNGEFENIKRGIGAISGIMESGSRLAVITFHSLEDRIVKERFAALAGDGLWKHVTRKPVKPSEAETLRNPRARSAQLRVMEKL